MRNANAKIAAGGIIMARTKAAIVSEKLEEDANVAVSSEDRIRHLAYLKWLEATGGQTVPGDPEGLQFWLEAEKELDADGTAS